MSGFVRAALAGLATCVCAAPVAAAPALLPAPAGAVVTLPATGLAVTMPAGASGWQLASDAGNDGLFGGGAQIGIARETRTCAAWAAEPAPEALPDWAPTTFWPIAHAASDGHILCVQRADAAFLVGITVTGGASPAADARAVLLAVADAVRAPLAYASSAREKSLQLRLPVPATPRPGARTLDALDGTTRFTFQIFELAGACYLGRSQLEADDATTEPWLPAHIAQGDHESVCAEFAEHALGLAWPVDERPLRAATMRALAAAGLAAWGAAVTNAHGDVRIGGKDVRLDPSTAGRWKLVATGAATELDPLDGAVPFVIVVTPAAACPGGEPLAEEDSQGFAPPALQPVRRSATTTATATLRLTSCVQGGTHAAPRDTVVEVRALSKNGEPPSGPAAVSVRATLVAIATALGLDPEVAAPHTRERPEVREQPSHPTDYRSDVGVWGGVLGLTATGDATHYGALAGADLRSGPKSGVGLVATLDGEIGYGNGTQEELRGSLGAGFGVGGLSVGLSAGARVGALGPDGDAAGYVQLGVLVDLGTVIASAAALQELVGADTRRYDLRLAFAPRADRGTFMLGAQLGQLLDEAVGSANTLVFYVGVGFTSAHDAAAQ